VSGNVARCGKVIKDLKRFFHSRESVSKRVVATRLTTAHFLGIAFGQLQTSLLAGA
jgi:hypothetical protein